jgi:D-glycero-D-manno-heptose 1,7-bisphosphate phosphatase
MTIDKTQYKAIFIDKDGTLVEDVPYNVDPAKIKLYPDVPEALLKWQKEGFKIIVITNQSGVAHGYFEEKAIQGVKETLEKMFEQYGIVIDGFFYCPHHHQGKVEAFAIDCECRKPKPGMIKRAAKELNIDLSQSWMIGDILNDVEAGNRAGCNTILIDNGNETEWIVNRMRAPTYTVKTVGEAADKILNHEISLSGVPKIE